MALRAALVCAVVIALDQLTKHTLGTWIRPGQVRHVIPGLKLVYERNTGVAFSFLAGTGALVYVVTGFVLIALAMAGQLLIVVHDVTASLLSGGSSSPLPGSWP